MTLTLKHLRQYKWSCVTAYFSSNVNMCLWRFEVGSYPHSVWRALWKLDDDEPVEDFELKTKRRRRTWLYQKSYITHKMQIAGLLGSFNLNWAFKATDFLLYLLVLPDPVVLPGLRLAKERRCRDPPTLSFPLLESWPLFISTSSCVCSPPLSSHPAELVLPRCSSPEPDPVPLVPGSCPLLVWSLCPARSLEPGEEFSSSPSGKPSPPSIPCCKFSSDWSSDPQSRCSAAYFHINNEGL